MELTEIIVKLEEIMDLKLNEENMKQLVGPIMTDLLSDFAKKEDVLTYEQLTQRQAEAAEKTTFSQWLGDVSRIQKGETPIHSKQPELDYIVNPDNGMTHKDLNKIYTGIASGGGTDTGFTGVDKSMYTSSNTAGGYLVPTEESRTLIDLTDNWEVIPGLCQQVPMRTNVITYPTLTDGLTAYWIPEPVKYNPSSQSDGVKQASDMTLGQMTITTHVLAILVYVSNQLLDDSEPSIDQILYNAFGKTLGSYFDLACLSGAGTATDPVTGLDGLITTNSIATGATLDFDDIIDLLASVENASKGPSAIPNITMVGNSRPKHVLRKVKDTTGNYIWRDPTVAAQMGTIYGVPYAVDNNVSITEGAGGDKSVIYAGDFANYAYVGNSMNMVIKANPWMSAAFTGNMTVFLAEFRRGFQVSDETLFAELTGVPIT